jgi:pimeloyl-ACP methyl ester carboxylesterase
MLKNIMKHYLAFLMVVIVASGCASRSQRLDIARRSEREPSTTPADFVQSFDGFLIPVIVESPDKTDARDVQRVVVFAHGSGPQNADGDLSSVTLPADRPNLIYKDIAGALRNKGFTTARFNKRAFEARTQILKDPNYVQSKEYVAFSENPLGYFINDLKAICANMKSRFPNAKIFILGHSEGTNLALWVMDQEPIDGVALIGFANEKQSTLVHEQFVNRAFLNYFRPLDKNNNLKIDRSELNSKDPLAQQLKAQLGVVDLNRDGVIDLTEYNAGNYANAVLYTTLYDINYSAVEAKMPRPSDVIHKTNLPVLFLQGELDNQTPSYYAKGVEIANQISWKKPNLKFVYFPGKGHALDARTSYSDLTYKKIEPKTLTRLASEIDHFLK